MDPKEILEQVKYDTKSVEDIMAQLDRDLYSVELSHTSEISTGKPKSARYLIHTLDQDYEVRFLHSEEGWTAEIDYLSTAFE